MLENVSVIGAAGKMGKGIALVLLQVMAQKKLADPKASIRLNLIDKMGLDTLHPFLREHLRTFAEKNINHLRSLSDLVSNEEVIQAFVDLSLDCVWLGNEWQQSDETFEAIDEDIQAKKELIQTLDGTIFTNTSSIPIHQLADKKRVIGLHFYNPPHVQSLVELVALNPSDRELAMEVVNVLGKVAVEPNDVAGFIGNGQFIREVNFACHLVEELAKGRSYYQALYMVDRITRDFLLRPMGIFQLVDYIGIDVCLKIANMMSNVPELLTKISNKGCFQYDDHTPVAVYDIESKSYKRFDEGQWMAECHTELGSLPKGHYPWKVLSKHPDKNALVSTYLKSLFQETGFGSMLAQNFLDESKNIAEALVDDGVAKSMEDVKTVMRLGFHHLYGPEL